MTNRLNSALTLILVVVAAVCAYAASSYTKNGEIGEMESRVAEAERRSALYDSLASDARRAYMAVGDTLIMVRDSVAVRISEAAREASRASSAYNSLAGRVRALAGDSAKVVAVVDSMTVAHGEQVAALTDQILAIDSERAILWRKVAVSDTLISKQQDQINALQAERDALKGLVQALNAPASPSVFQKVQRTLPAVGAGVVIGTLLIR